MSNSWAVKTCRIPTLFAPIGEVKLGDVVGTTEAISTSRPRFFLKPRPRTGLQQWLESVGEEFTSLPKTQATTVFRVVGHGGDGRRIRFCVLFWSMESSLDLVSFLFGWDISLVESINGIDDGPLRPEPTDHRT